jgi:hypothetical protein
VALRHNIIFTPTDGFDEASQLARETDGDAIVMASGRFILWEGDRSRFARIMDRLMSGRRPIRWFNQIPVGLDVSGEPSHLFAFTAVLDLSQRFLGIALENKSGLWTVTGTSMSLEPPENGKLSLGWKDFPAIRLRFLGPKGKRATIVLASESRAALQTVISKLSR